MPPLSSLSFPPQEASPLPPSRGVKVAALRELLKEKFPEAPARKEAHFLTGLEAIDRAQGLPRAAVTEICGTLGAGSLMITALAQAAHRARCYSALIDGGRTFDAFDLSPKILQRLLWVLCADAKQAIKAADLLLRDGNLPLVLLDLQPLPAKELRRIPASTWHRFHRIAEQSDTAFVVLTPAPMVEGVRVRVAMENRWTLQALTRRRRTLIEELELKVFDKRVFIAALDRELKTA
jgi:hypothetical protein